MMTSALQVFRLVSRTRWLDGGGETVGFTTTKQHMEALFGYGSGWMSEKRRS